MMLMMEVYAEYKGRVTMKKDGRKNPSWYEIVYTRRTLVRSSVRRTASSHRFPLSLQATGCDRLETCLVGCCRDLHMDWLGSTGSCANAFAANLNLHMQSADARAGEWEANDRVRFSGLDGLRTGVLYETCMSSLQAPCVSRAHHDPRLWLSGSARAGRQD